jgi:coproporphyrinogen III oxidase-like Fe-S oxidoreductase
MTTDFKHRLREFFYYPKLSRDTDSVPDQRAFTAYLNEPAQRSDPFSMYIHIPFCDYLCHFCPFMKVLNQQTDAGLKRRFFEAMAWELRTYAASPYLAGRQLEWIEFGGGTPTSIEPEYLELLLSTIHDNFQVRPNTVITMEGDAITLADRAKMALLRSYGVNRVSFGVQTFNEQLRRRLGLKPTVEDLYRAVESIRDVGMHEFAIDILYNLPDQSQQTLASDIEQAMTLAPDYIDFYSLTLWENTTFKQRVEEGKTFTLPPSNERNIAMFGQIQAAMRGHGFEAARSYTYVTKAPHEFIQLSKNRIRQRGEALGIGASSRGYVGSRHFINASSIEHYTELAEAGLLPVELGAVCGPDEEAHRLMVLFPAMLLEIDTADVPGYERLFAPIVADLVAAGHVWTRHGRIGLTDSGMLWAGNISRQFFSPVQRGRMTESFLYTLREHVNPYNQDRVGVRKGGARTA